MADEQTKRAALTFDQATRSSATTQAARAAIATSEPAPVEAERTGKHAPLTIDMKGAPGVASSLPANDATPASAAEPIRAVADAPKVRTAPFAAPTDHGVFKRWVDGAMTHLELFGFKDHRLEGVSGEEVTRRLKSLSEWEKRQRGQGAAGSNPFLKYLDSELGRARWKELFAVGAGDALSNLRALIPKMEQDKAVHALREKAYGMIERDKLLDRYEHFFLREFAEELGNLEHVSLEADDAREAVRFWERTRDWTVVVEEPRNPADLRFNVACLSSAFGDATPYSIGEVHAVLADNTPKFERVMQAFAMEHVQNWLRNLELQLPETSSDKKVLQGQFRSAKQVALEQTPVSVWRFMWETGYTTLHLPRNMVVRSAKELRKKVNKTEHIERAIEENLLPLWCETVLKDAPLANFARTRGRSPRAAANAFLWALGQTEFRLGDTPVATPRELAMSAVASRSAFDALTSNIAAGDVEDWFDALSYRKLGDFRELKSAMDSHGTGPAAARLRAYCMVAELLAPPDTANTATTTEANQMIAELLATQSPATKTDAKSDRPVLPLFATSRVRLVRTPLDLAEAVQQAPSSVEEALANGGFAVWLVSVGNDPRTAARIRQWYEQEHPTTQRAAYKALRILGDLSLPVGRHIVTHLGQLFAVFEDVPEALHKVGGERLLLDWLEAYRGREPNAVTFDAFKLASAHDGSAECTQRLMWALGYRALRAGSTTVTSVAGLRDIADAEPCLAVRLLQSKLAQEFCELVEDAASAQKLMSVRHELDEETKQDALLDDESLSVLFAASRMAEALGAVPGQLELRDPDFDLGEMGPGDQRSVALRLSNAGARGAIKCRVSTTSNEHVTLEPQTGESFILAGRSETTLEVNVTLSKEAPPGTFGGRVELEPLPGEARAASFRIRRATPWSGMILEVLLHMVVLAASMVMLRAIFGLVLESVLTTSSGVVTNSIGVLDVLGFSLLGLVVGMIIALVAVDERVDKVVALIGGAFVGWLTTMFIGLIGIALIRSVDGAALLLAERFTSMALGTGAAHLGWLLLGAVGGFSAGVQQTITRNYSSEWGTLAGFATAAASLLLFI